MLHLDLLALPTPQLPKRRLAVLEQCTASAAVHLAVSAAAVLVQATFMLSGEIPPPTPPTAPGLQHIVFAMPITRQTGGGGGGGGGNRQEGPMPRAQSIGSDAITLRVRKEPPAAPPLNASSALVDVVPQPPAIQLDVKPLASGFFEQIGVPTGEILSAHAAGRGSGGGAGTGSGTGIGPGRGPGLGHGSGGGTGGGIYRAGGPVTWPRLISQVKPNYTSDALRSRLQGTVVLEAVVTEDGCTAQIRVVKSLDPGLDEQAVIAVAQWEFEPGRLAGAPVNVLVRVLVDFRVW